MGEKAKGFCAMSPFVTCATSKVEGAEKKKAALRRYRPSPQQASEPWPIAALLHTRRRPSVYVDDKDIRSIRGTTGTTFSQFFLHSPALRLE